MQVSPTLLLLFCVTALRVFKAAAKYAVYTTFSVRITMQKGHVRDEIVCKVWIISHVALLIFSKHFKCKSLSNG